MVSFSLNMEYFSFHHSTERTYNDKFAALFGTPRPEKMLFFTEETGFYVFGTPPGNMAELSKMNKHYANIAAVSIQKVTERCCQYGERSAKTTGMKNLCMAGGVAMNCVANTRILHESGFEQFYAQLAPGDGGGSAGRGVVGLQHAAGQAAQLSDGRGCVLGPSTRMRRSAIFCRQNNIQAHPLRR